MHYANTVSSAHTVFPAAEGNRVAGIMNRKFYFRTYRHLCFMNCVYRKKNVISTCIFYQVSKNDVFIFISCKIPLLFLT